MVNWYNNLPKREQWLLIAGSVFVVLFVFVNAIWKPLITQQERLTNSNQAAIKNIAWMKQAAQEIKTLRKTVSAGNAGAQLSLSQMVDKAAANQGLRVSRFQPSGNEEAQVWLEKVEYSKVLAWLNQMESTYGVTIKTAAINSVNVAGVVTARIRIKKGA
jgi:general secretion pathway protein M